MLDFLLPMGFKHSPEASVLLRWKNELTGSGKSRPPSEENLAFQPGEGVRLVLNTTQDRELALDVTLYYCQTQAEHLCLIHTERVNLPLKISPGKPTAVHLGYNIATVETPRRR